MVSFSEIVLQADLPNLHIKKYSNQLQPVRVMIFLYTTIVSLIKLIFQSRFKSRCLVYMFSLRFSRRKFLINLRGHFRLRKVFLQRQLCTQVFAGFTDF